MAKIARAGVNQVIDTVDMTTLKAFEALREVEDAAVETVHGAVDVTDTTVDELMNEAEGLRKRLMEILRSVADAATEPLP